MQFPYIAYLGEQWIGSQIVNSSLFMFSIHVFCQERIPSSFISDWKLICSYSCKFYENENDNENLYLECYFIRDFCLPKITCAIISIPKLLSISVFDGHWFVMGTNHLDRIFIFSLCNEACFSYICMEIWHFFHITK